MTALNQKVKKVELLPVPVLASGKPHETYFCRKKCCKHFPVLTCYVVN
jgi:hypothetical protein